MWCNNHGITMNKPRFQQIKQSNKGQYVSFYGRRYYLNQFMRTQNHETATGWLGLSNTTTLLVQISECGEGAKLWIE